MKFAKVLETNAENMPAAWRPYLIQYKFLKKRISGIVKELEDRGLPSPVIKTLLNQTMSGEIQRVEYSFEDGEAHLKPSIRVVLDDAAIESTCQRPPSLTTSPDDPLARLLSEELALLELSDTASTTSSADVEALEEEEDDDDEQLESDDKGPQPQQQPPLKSSAAAIVAGAPSGVESAGTAAIGNNSQAINNESIANINTISPNTNNTRSNQNINGNSINTTTTSIPSDIVTSSKEASTQSAPSSTCTETGFESKAVAATQTLRSQLRAETNVQTFTATPAVPIIPFASNIPSPLSLPPLKPHQQDDLPDQHTPYNPSSEKLETIYTPGAEEAQVNSGSTTPERAKRYSRVETSEQDGKRVLIIELTSDTAFFDELGQEITQLSKLQDANKLEFEGKVNALSKILTTVSSPGNKDMYTWREILRLYLDAEVFVGDHEADRSTHTSAKALSQLEWFMNELKKNKLLTKLKMSKSKTAFQTFFTLNSDLVTMSQFRELNQLAMFKILKKHDKRTSLSASAGFPKLLQNQAFYSDDISKALTYTIGCQLISIIPQPDDYSCPICMCVAWKPIRLNRCNHVFCVRCLIKAQRKNMRHCPICREESVMEADASNLDEAMMRFIQLYFPKEIKDKRKDSNREQALEDIEALNLPTNASCVIM